MNEMYGRLANGIAGAIFVLIGCALAGLVALLAKLIFKKSIGTPKYYSIVGFLAFVVGNALLLSVPKTDTTQSVHRTSSEPASVDTAGLDAPFIAPPEDKMESFVGQLNTAVEQLSPADKASFTEAMEFLTYAAAEYIKENEPTRFAKWDQKDVTAHSLAKMYYFARGNGDKMTLRKYILLADDGKKQNPALFAQYKAAEARP